MSRAMTLGWRDRLSALLLVLLCGCQAHGQAGVKGLPVRDLVEAPDFHLDVFAIVPGAASLTVAADGLVHVATDQGEVVRLEDHDGDGIADEATRLDFRLEAPVELASTEDGEVVALARDSVLELTADGARPIVPSGVLPPPGAGSRHDLTSGPDGHLYVSLGEPCAGCRGRSLAGSIMGMRPDGHGLKVHVRAIRRPGALAWHPHTADLAFTDQAPGRIARERGVSGLFRLEERPVRGFHGFEQIGLVQGDDWIHVVPELNWTFAPALEPSGMAFYDGDSFPMTLADALLVALNPAPGSEAEAKVIAVRFDRDGRPLGERVLLTGWRRNGGEPWGRPVDIAVHPDGSVLITDDLAGVVYRLTYRP